MTDKRYAYLTSLDLICDQPEIYELWINEVCSCYIAIGAHVLMAQCALDGVLSFFLCT